MFGCKISSLEQQLFFSRVSEVVDLPTLLTGSMYVTSRHLIVFLLVLLRRNPHSVHKELVLLHRGIIRKNLMLGMRLCFLQLNSLHQCALKHSLVNSLSVR